MDPHRTQTNGIRKLQLNTRPPEHLLYGPACLNSVLVFLSIINDILWHNLHYVIDSFVIIIMYHNRILWDHDLLIFLFPASSVISFISYVHNIFEERKIRGKIKEKERKKWRKAGGQEVKEEGREGDNEGEREIHASAYSYGYCKWLQTNFLLKEF